MSKISIDDITLDSSLIRDAAATAVRAYQQSRLQFSDAKLQDRDSCRQGLDHGTELIATIDDSLSQRPHVDIRIDIHVSGDLVIHDSPSPGSTAAP